MTTMFRRGLLIIGLLGTAGIVSAQSPATLANNSGNPMADYWKNPDFVKDFLGTYGFKTEVEPKFLNPEEVQFYNGLVEIIGDQPEEAAKQLEGRVTGDSSAILDFALATLKLQLGENKEAIKYLEIATAKFPNYLRAWQNLGLAKLQEGDYPKAAEALSKAVGLGGANSSLYGMLGFAMISQEHYISAEAAYKNAVLLDAKNLEWKLGLVKCYVAQSKFDEAIRLLDEVLESDPENDKMWDYQARIFMQTENFKKAAVNFEILRRMEKASSSQLLTLGDVYMMQGSQTLALEAYLGGIAAKGGSENLERALRTASLLSSRGSFEDASALLNQLQNEHEASLTGEQKAQIWKLEAKADLAQDRGEKAAETLEKVIAANPLDGEALILTGDYFAGIDEREKAEFRYERAAKISGHEANAWVKHARLLVQHQKYVKALELLTKAQKLDPRESVQRYIEAVQRVAGS